MYIHYSHDDNKGRPTKHGTDTTTLNVVAKFGILIIHLDEDAWQTTNWYSVETVPTSGGTT